MPQNHLVRSSSDWNGSPGTDTEAGHSHVHGHLDGHSHAYSLGHEHSHSHGVDHEAREVHAHHAHSADGGSPVRLLFNGMHSEGPQSPGGVAASTTAAGGGQGGPQPGEGQGLAPVAWVTKKWEPLRKVFFFLKDRHP